MLNVSAIAQHWPAITAALGTAGGIATAIPTAKWLDHRRDLKRIAVEAAQAKREQSDEVALDLVDKLTRRIDDMETAHEIRIGNMETASAHERELCAMRIASLQNELLSISANFDGFLLALKYAAPEKIPEIVADVLSRRNAAILSGHAEMPQAAAA